MPAVVPVYTEIRSRLREVTEHACTLNEQLEAVIAVKTGQPSGGFHGKAVSSSPPWYSPVAHIIMDLHAQVREAEAALRLSLHLPSRPRGGSSANTGKALDAILALCEGADDAAVRSCTRMLDAWCRKASIALGKTEFPRRLPRMHGDPERPCAWCKNRTLRMFPLEGEIRCINPACRDEEGRKPRAQLEYSPVVKDLVLVWMDNETGLP